MKVFRTFSKCVYARYTHVENHASFRTERHGDVLEIMFECSNGLVDWLNNFNFIADVWRSVSIPKAPYKNMEVEWKCHRGFLKVWKSAEKYLQPEIMDPAVKRIVIVGYSHGAAVAQLCHEYCVFNRPDVSVSGIGFGSPRVFYGKSAGAAVVKERLKDFHIIRNGNDIVTHVPPRFLGFRHVAYVYPIGDASSRNVVTDHKPMSYSQTIWREESEHEEARKNSGST